MWRWTGIVQTGRGLLNERPLSWLTATRMVLVSSWVRELHAISTIPSGDAANAGRSRSSAKSALVNVKRATSNGWGLAHDEAEISQSGQELAGSRYQTPAPPADARSAHNNKNRIATNSSGPGSVDGRGFATHARCHTAPSNWIDRVGDESHGTIAQPCIDPA